MSLVSSADGVQPDSVETLDFKILEIQIIFWTMHNDLAIDSREDVCCRSFSHPAGSGSELLQLRFAFCSADQLSCFSFFSVTPHKCGVLWGIRLLSSHDSPVRDPSPVIARGRDCCVSVGSLPAPSSPSGVDAADLSKFYPRQILSRSDLSTTGLTFSDPLISPIRGCVYDICCPVRLKACSLLHHGVWCCQTLSRVERFGVGFYTHVLSALFRAYKLAIGHFRILRPSLLASYSLRSLLLSFYSMSNPTFKEAVTGFYKMSEKPAEATPSEAMKEKLTIDPEPMEKSTSKAKGKGPATVEDFPKTGND